MSTLPLPLGSYRLPAPEASARQLVNCYAESLPPDPPRGQPATLIRAPGIAAFADTEKLEVRGLKMMGDTLFACAGDTLYSCSSGGTLTALTGDAISGNGRVRLETNGTDLIVCPGNGEGFRSDGSTVSQITDSTFTSGDGGADPAFLDGYLIFRRRSSAQFFNTGINEITFNALDVATAEGAPDKLVGLFANNRELILPGETSTERWYDAANATGSPFSRSPDGFYGIGCAAGESLCEQDNAPVMLANDFTFRRLGGTWERVSHHGIESIVQRMSVKSDCYALPYRQEGHHFVAFTFPNAARTFIVDFNTGEWHERESRIDTVSLGYWRPSCIAQAYGKQIVGDSRSGKLGILDPDTHEEWGEPQVVRWAYQPVYAAGQKASHRRLEIGIAAGRGTASGQGENPLLTLFVSNDGGNTFPIVRPVKSLGRLGEYRRRVQYWNLGESAQRVYVCEVSDPIRLFVVDTQLDVDGARR